MNIDRYAGGEIDVEEMRRLLPPPPVPPLSGDRHQQLKESLMRDIELLDSSQPGETRSPNTGSTPLGLRRRAVTRRVALAAVVTTAAAAAVVGFANNTGSGGTGTGQAGGTVNGSRVLLVAATHAAGTSETVKAYWRTTTAIRRLELAGPESDPYRLKYTANFSTWTASSPSKPGRFAPEVFPRTPATSEDRATWKRDGSPQTFDIRFLGQDGKVGVSKNIPAIRKNSLASKTVDISPGTKVFDIGQAKLSLEEIRALPSDLPGLRTVLLNNFEETRQDLVDHPNLGSKDEDDWTEDRWLFSNASQALTMPVTPAVRSSLYRLLAGLKSVHEIGRTTDLEGRTGNAVVITWHSLAGLEEDRLIIDDRTGSLLAQETRLVKPVAAMSWVKPTDVYESAAVTQNGWTDDKPPAAQVHPTGELAG